MKRVTLLGDSIRLGYQKTVIELLQGEAEVWAPEGNCMHSLHHFFNLGWYTDRPADVIHFNFGLWDARRLGEHRPENALPVEIFARNLDFILGQVRQKSTAKLIWATCTPIVESRYNGKISLPFWRAESDSVLYNEAAAPVLARHGVLVNDLYAFVMEQGREEMICHDGVHFTDEASRRLGEKVAAAIQQALG